MVVSHDRYFLNRVCNHIISFEGDGRVLDTVGDFDYYQKKKEERQAAERETLRKTESRPVPAPPVRKNVPKKLSFREERELESLEESIAGYENRIAEIERIFSDPDFFAKHGSESAALSREREEAGAALERAYARWEELESKKESFQERG